MRYAWCGVKCWCDARYWRGHHGASDGSLRCEERCECRRKSRLFWGIASSSKFQAFWFLISSGAHECCNFVLSWRYGNKRGDYVLCWCFARFKCYYIVVLLKIAGQQAEHIWHILCLSRCFSLDFFYANGRGCQELPNVMSWTLRFGKLTELFAV